MNSAVLAATALIPMPASAMLLLRKRYYTGNFLLQLLQNTVNVAI